MASKAALERALGVALTTGGDFAEIFWEDTRKTRMNLIDGKIENYEAGREHGAGVRVYRELESAYVYTNDTSEAGLCAAARAAADAIGANRGEERPVSLVRSVAANAHVIRELPLDVPGSAKARLLHDVYSAAKAESPLIAQVSAQVIGRDTDVIIANSEGRMVADRRVYTRLAVNAVASENGENQTGFSGPGAQRGFEFFRETIDPEAEARNAARTALTMLRASDQMQIGRPILFE